MLRIRAGSGMARAGESLRIARAVPPLVVAQGDVVRHGKNHGMRSFQHLGPDRRMGFHNLEFGGRQFSRLPQDGVGNADLAHVVHRGGQAEGLGVGRGPACRQGQRFAQQPRAPDVHAGLFVAAERGRHQPVDRLFMRQADFGRLLADPFFEVARVVAAFLEQLPAFQGGM